MLQDVEEVRDDDLLYRRLAPATIEPDGRVNSNAYKYNGRPSPSISVDLARLTTPIDSVNRAGRPGFRLGQLRVSDVRNLGFAVLHRPDMVERNDAHCVIEGAASRKACRDLARLTTVVPDVVSD
jgi:hypothetical protein